MARVKVDLADAKKKMKLYKDKARRELVDELKTQIITEIEGGRSPVQGGKRYQKYSDSYREAIREGRYSQFGKRRSPVNLKLTGELLSSLFTRMSPKGLLVGFDNKLADIHNRLGAGKSKVVRRMLPTEKGERFNRSITSRLTEVLNRVARNIFR